MGQKQRVLKIGEDRIITRPSIEKFGQHLKDSKNAKAWFLIRDLLKQVKGPLGNWGAGYWIALDARSSIPISPYREEYPDKETLNNLLNQDKIADQASMSTSNQTDIQNHKSKFYDFIGLAIMGLVCIFALVIILAVTGHINIAGFVQSISGGAGASK